jgi:hypothetical protein
MKGLDPRFTDLSYYILKCTAQIWEGHDITARDWHYGDDLIVRTPAGNSRGLRRETTLIDDIAIWKQILLQTGEQE